MTTTTFSAAKGALAAQAAFGAAAEYAAGGRQETGTTASRQPVSHREPPAAARIGTAISTDLWHTDGYDWAALAMCETGQNWHAHGPVYATAFGISTGASEQTPASLAGEASPDEQVRIAIAVERRAGIHAWGCWRAAVYG